MRRSGGAADRHLHSRRGADRARGIAASGRTTRHRFPRGRARLRRGVDREGAFAEQRDFPAAFAAVHDRFRTPHISILVYAVLVWTLAI